MAATNEIGKKVDQTGEQEEEGDFTQEGRMKQGWIADINCCFLS